MKEKIIKVLQTTRNNLLKDIQTHHLSRIMDGIEKGYPDENQGMIVIDHLMRVRIYDEIIEQIKEIK